MDYSNLNKEQLVEMLQQYEKENIDKLGLTWEKEKVPEKIVVDCDKKIPVLKEIKNKNMNYGGDNNILIQGDNFHALSVLNYTHSNKIDLIYIDLPYNTGSKINKDFVYNDYYVDTEDNYRHSKWLNFMEKRLRLAWSLLKNDGLIFISIDDNELYQLKLLCDLIFKPSNYLSTINVRAKVSSGASGGGEDKKLKKNIEYILMYCKRKADYIPVKQYRETELYDYIKNMEANKKSYKYTNVMYKIGKKKYVKTIKDGKGKDIKLYRIDEYKSYTVKQLAEIEGLSEKEIYYKYFDKIYTTSNSQTSIRKKVNDAVGNKIKFYSAVYEPEKGKNKGNKNYEVFYLNPVQVLWLKDTLNDDIQSGLFKREEIGTLWDDINWNNVSKEGNVAMKFGKKPIDLIKRCIKYSTNKDATILDFFAGSGSTGHAVLSLNKIDDGHRKFILCTNNESNICTEKTYPRLKNVMGGYKINKKNIKGLDGNLKYFKTDFVNLNKTKDQLYIDLTEKSIPLFCIKNDTYELIKKSKDYYIFSNKSQTCFTCVYFDYYNTDIDKFVSIVRELKGKKNCYIFSFDDLSYIDSFDDVTNAKVETIPERILNVYRQIIRKSKGTK